MSIFAAFSSSGNGGYQSIDESKHSNLEIEQQNYNISNNDSRIINRIKKNKFWFISIFLIVLGIFCSFQFSTFFRNSESSENLESHSLFDSNGRYILKDFDESKPFSSFLAGLGGIWGVPMWAFYVNRGQGITSFGFQNKDNAIAKFNTAEKAYQVTPFTGFRTFIRGTRGSETFSHMPFFPLNENNDVKRSMMIGMNELEIEEKVNSLGLQTNILYYTITNEDFPGLIRQTTFTNLDKDTTLDIDVLDGLAKLIPSGLNNGVLEAMGRTMEAWMNVYNVGGKDEGVTQPFYHISQGTADTAQVQIIKEGHFVISFIQPTNDEEITLLPFIVDPNLVFETDTTLTTAKGFFKRKFKNLSDFMTLPQGTTSRTPCAFAGSSLSIQPRTNVTITSVYGHAEDLETFIGKYYPTIVSKGFITKKRYEADKVVEDITSKVTTSTASSLFDNYVKQDFLDNVLRGGMPLLLGSDSNTPKIYHTFSRIHGDIERDYNFFQIDTTYYSQGPGNFRDVNQNRRIDVLHTPEIGTFNIEMFLSFIQADGYNPLTVATCNFKTFPEKVTSAVSIFQPINEQQTKVLTDLLKKPYRIGQLFKDVASTGISIPKSIDERNKLVNSLLDISEQVFAAQFNQNGFWADHWTYTLDLIESYLSVFPDKEELMLWDSPKMSQIPFYMSPAIVQDRKDRYSLVQPSSSSSTKSIRAYSAVSIAGSSSYPKERDDAMKEIYMDSSYVADIYGQGAPWQRSKANPKSPFTVTAFTKLLMLSVLKFSTSDPFGMGIEMEAGKPGWNDAMNGLPGLLGSGLSETYEMLRIIKYLHRVCVNYSSRVIQVPTEFAILIEAMSSNLDFYFSNLPQINSDVISNDIDFQYWDSANIARESYRRSIQSKFLGTYESITSLQLKTFLDKIIRKTNIGITRAISFSSRSGLSPTYFYYDAIAFRIVDNSTTPNKVLPTKFKLNTLPIFLEGPVRQFKVVEDIHDKKSIYSAVKSSYIYDKELKMFMLSESLQGLSQEVGRMMAFSPGWLENQSVWLHMSYKFYLELIKGGLYKEFFDEIATGLVPFMNNKVYGRSPLEAASFIVSSAFPDKNLHGSGFLARLSGSTAEFLSMWAIMMAGHQPFALNSENQLILQFQPVLPGWLFTADTKQASFTFLGSTKVTYHNPKRLDTWTISPISIDITDKSGTVTSFASKVLDSSTAERVRSGQVASIDVYF